MSTIINSVKGFLGRKASKLVLSAAALAGLAGMSSSASAADVTVIAEVGHRHDDYFVNREVRFLVPAQYRTVCDKVYIQPVYQTRCEKVWVEPVFQTRCDKVLVPEVVEVRNVRRYDSRSNTWLVTTERVCVRPARWETRETRVLVTPGHFEEIRKQVCVTEGFYRTVERQELVCDAHYETRIERVREVRPVIFVPQIVLPFGYHHHH
jgi:hypothetical protein